MSPSKPPASSKDQPPAGSQPGEAARAARLAAALRENLKRRKAQARARREPGSGSRQD